MRGSYWIGLFALVIVGCGGGAPERDDTRPKDDPLASLWKERFLSETKELVRIKTYRASDRSEAEVTASLDQVKQRLGSWAERFNKGQKNLRLEPFEWSKAIEGQTYRLFGWRLGSGPRKLAVICHLDTVPPGSASWKAFEPYIEKRTYMGQQMDFLVGRGSIDDKGPAVAAFLVLRALARHYDSEPEALAGCTLEVIFDTSEETDMATPHYLKAVPDALPAFGVVFDAMWAVRAEKGLERPVFTLKREEEKVESMWIESLDTPDGPPNQIPGKATAVIRAARASDLASYAKGVEAAYQACPFDDKKYRRAALEIKRSGDELVLTTRVAGAQHGSAPEENRAEGANPLVSLAGFLAWQVAEGKLAANAVGRMARFMAWGWGTRVFGEAHPELLQAKGAVFTDGTTYALTRLRTTPKAVELKIDIRYALGHHAQAWDGKTPGIVPGKSRFTELFTRLTEQFSKAHPGQPVRLTTTTVVGPDLRLPDSPQFRWVADGYKEVVGKPCPLLAIGGGTDAKGYPSLIAAGPLFSTQMGPPINYHGIDEAAPLPHMELSAKILYHIMQHAIRGK